jgi:anaerobic selenocysteine-containing dehydrogenase
VKRIEPSEEVLTTACPRDCYDTCGITVIRRDGVVTAVRGNPQHPVSRGALCGKCSTAYNREWRDPARRLSQPQRRVGRKGHGGFEPVSWERAIGEIAARLTRIVESHGAQAILNSHYTGTMAAGGAG